jgi:hypothetical protein
MKVLFSWAQLTAIEDSTEESQLAAIEDSTEEWLTASSGEGSFGLPSPKRHSTGGPFAPIATTTRKKNSPATTRFLLRMAEPWLETNHPSERYRTHYKGQPTKDRAQHPTAEHGTTSR